MKTLWVEKEIAYDGTQLQSLYAYLNHQVLGNSCVAWVGSCNVDFKHMVDCEDLLAKSSIKGSRMLHFIIEIFERDLFSAVVLQRLFAGIIKDHLSAKAQIKMIRDGDDIFFDGRKLSISIATESSRSVMVHFAVNVSNQGTPVPTAALEEFGVSPKEFATECMELLSKEYSSMVEAVHKVRAIP